LLRFVSLCISQPLLPPSTLQNELIFKGYDYFGQEISNLKANAAGLTQQNNAKPVSDTNIPKAKPDHPLGSQSKLPEGSREVSKPQSSSVLPPGFFDDNDPGKTRSGKNLVLKWNYIFVLLYIFISELQLHITGSDNNIYFYLHIFYATLLI